MTNVIQFLGDMENDYENKKHGLPTRPFGKQGQILDLFSDLAVSHPSSFFLSPFYYPEETRDKIDIENLSLVSDKIIEINKAKENSLKEQQSNNYSMRKAA